MHDTSKVCGHSGEEDYVPARTGGAQPLSGRRLTSTETIRLIRDGEEGGGSGREGDYISIATLLPPE